ncbi:MAG: PAS domain-containing protein [Candidatus Thermoplasmatota archaeon]|nr:PAS domain-containing protein [Candidatus Thermoplasmatota archaeon]
MTTIHTGDDMENPDTSHDLILSLSLNEEIIQFNKESERFTGYLRDEILHKNFYEILVPAESAQQWKDLLTSIQQSMWVDNIVLPLKTKNNENPMIAWTGFLVKDETGSIKDICIFGKPLKSDTRAQNTLEVSVTPSLQVDELKISAEPLPKAAPITPSESYTDVPKQQNTKPITRHGSNKILFAKEKKAEDEQTKMHIPDVSSPPVETREVVLEKTSTHFNTMDQALRELSQKYEAVAHRITSSEGKEQRQDNKQSIPDKSWDSIQKSSLQTIQAQDTTDESEQTFDEQSSQDEKLSFFSDPFGFKRQHRELDARQQQLDIRLKQLEAFEAQLKKEKRIFNARVEEFSKWREKLLLLETAIEKRRQELMNQENITFSQVTAPASTPETETVKQETQKTGEPIVPTSNDETLEKISQSAAIIQRGIVKQINTSFLELLGYSMEEMLEKSYFDFIALEGLADVEKYYLDRLKGDRISMYRTVFTKKDDIKIPVEVSIKQTIYRGEKAEIALITCIDSSQAD